MAIQSDGKIVVTGIFGSSDLAMARYNADGSLDTTFGTGGKVTTTGFAASYGFSVAIQGDGKIVVAGSSAGGGGFAVARYLAGEPAPTPTPTPVPGVSWPGLLALAGALASLLIWGYRRQLRRASS